MEDPSVPTATAPESAPTAASDVNAPPPTLSERELIRIEFYRTYDVMTGVRIAATLGGFFGLMVLLVVYKSKCKSRSLSDEHLEAAVAAAVIEEEEELALNALSLYGPRRSLGNMSAPSGIYPRFSSLGGYGLLNPPMRLCYGQRARVSLPVVETKLSPTPMTRLTLTSATPKRAYEEEDEEDDEYPVNFLQVPSRRASRRLSSITCSSSDTSYLERRGSAMEMGLPPPPPSRRPTLHNETWDFYYPIDIQVIQPTPELTPCGSEGTLYDRPTTMSPSGLCVPKMAPLASISSCAVSGSYEPDCRSIASDCHSIGSDSVFLDEECLDTEDEAEEFSTDSEVEEYMEQRKYLTDHFNNDNPSSVPFAEHLQTCRYPRTLAGRWHGNKGLPPVSRRFSSPSSQKLDKSIQNNSKDDEQFPSCSKSCDTFANDNILSRPQLPLPQSCSSESDIVEIKLPIDNKSVCNIFNQDVSEVPESEVSEMCLVQSSAISSASCDHLVRALTEQSRLESEPMKDIGESCSWSQETLF